MTSDHITDAMVEAGASAAYGVFVEQQSHPDRWPSWGEMVAQGHQGLWRVNEFRDIARAALLAAERAAWQPIATAPRDGTWILAYWPSTGGDSKVGLRTHPAFDMAVWCRPTEWLVEHWAANGKWTPGDPPTHWRPLPPAPEADHG